MTHSVQGACLCHRQLLTAAAGHRGRGPGGHGAGGCARRARGRGGGQEGTGGRGPGGHGGRGPPGSLLVLPGLAASCL